MPRRVSCWQASWECKAPRVRELGPAKGLGLEEELESAMMRRDKGPELEAIARRTQDPEPVAPRFLQQKVSCDDGPADSRDSESPTSAQVSGLAREMTARPLGRPRVIARQKIRLRRPGTRADGAHWPGHASQQQHGVKIPAMGEPRLASDSSAMQGATRRAAALDCHSLY
jgi:hypothetical protein